VPTTDSRLPAGSRTRCVHLPESLRSESLLHKTSRITARSRQGLDKAATNWVNDLHTALMSQLKRRNGPRVKGIAGSAAAWPLAAHAQGGDASDQRGVRDRCAPKKISNFCPLPSSSGAKRLTPRDAVARLDQRLCQSWCDHVISYADDRNARCDSLDAPNGLIESRNLIVDGSGIGIPYPRFADAAIEALRPIRADVDTGVRASRRTHADARLRGNVRAAMAARGGILNG
jgi:hypothetical protein